jgi:hypothetical protein
MNKPGSRLKTVIFFFLMALAGPGMSGAQSPSGNSPGPVVREEAFDLSLLGETDPAAGPVPSFPDLSLIKTPWALFPPVLLMLLLFAGRQQALEDDPHLKTGTETNPVRTLVGA